MPTESKNERAALAARLKEAREYVGLSQEEVAQILQIPRSAISLIEKGER
jgi:DNA-binding XRE family transcriptional regulator